MPENAETARLTETERDDLIHAIFEPGDDCTHNMVPLYAAVERIVAERMKSYRRTSPGESTPDAVYGNDMSIDLDCTVCGRSDYEGLVNGEPRCHRHME